MRQHYSTRTCPCGMYNVHLQLELALLAAPDPVIAGWQALSMDSMTVMQVVASLEDGLADLGDLLGRLQKDEAEVALLQQLLSPQLCDGIAQLLDALIELQPRVSVHHC
jgi:hypothetical protein